MYIETSNILNKVGNLGKVLGKATSRLTYASAMLFFLLAAMISFSVNNFVKSTLSISLVQSPNSLDDTNNQSTNDIIVKSGDTFSKILYKQDIPVLEVQAIINASKTLDKELVLKIGQQVSFEYDFSDKNLESQWLKRIVIPMDKTRFIEISRVGENFIAKDVVIPLKKVLVRSSTIVKNSFIEAAASLGISKANVIDLVNTYSHQIDFQRQIHKNDQLDLVLEKYIDEKGEFSHYGKVVYASLTLSGKPHHIYRYAHEGQNMQYFSEDGKSVKRNLLSTPISAARLSSHYGKRKHPILGYTKMHKGVDFAASTGTPIYAAGNGVISEIGWKNGYGNYVQIRHSGTLSTAYGHASRFASGLKRGTVVKQGQTIAFVGATGRATGPHLHYEVKINGRQVNPLSIKTSPGIELHGKKLAAFTAYKKKIHKIHKDLHTKGELHINDKLLDS